MTHGVKIIGIAGTNGSGKDAVGQLLAEHCNYLFISVTDIMREELTRRSLPSERENMRALSAEWRREFGLSVLVDRAVETFNQTGDRYAGVVMASLRNPYEADRVHELGGTMVWMDADPKIRYDRVQNSKRAGRIDDHKTFAQFTSEEMAEMHGTGDAASLNMLAVKERSDHVVVNDSSDLAKLEAAIIQTLGLNTEV
ncbi:MAG: AAA family ATPase [Candidatus Saccharibacteria bacterium]